MGARVSCDLLCVFAPLRLCVKNYFGVAVGEGFSAGGLVAEGAGGGTFSGTTLRVGSGSAGALRLLLPFSFEFEFVFVFVFAFASGVKSSTGEAATLALGLASAGGRIAPPDGIPSSPLPVAGCVGCTGWLFGSAASVGTCWFVFAPGAELLVNA